MILRKEEIKDVCSKILTAVDSNELSAVTETLELKTENKKLLLSVTNREYFAQVKLSLDDEEELHATVNANLFLKLISQITTDTIELEIKDTHLLVKGNGTYKLPLIYSGAELLELPRIDIGEITNEFDVNSDILLSIMNFNTKELSKGTIMRPVQKLFYIDEKGCITFTTGACVNSFTLPQPIKILLKPNVVKLFKLFKDGVVHFTLGHEALSKEIVQTKVKFETDDVSLTAILTNDDSLVSSVPEAAIRKRALNTYAHSITINKNDLLQTINRLSLFVNNASPDLESKFEFNETKVIIWDPKGENKEEVFYENDIKTPFTYSATLDLNDLKLTLENCTEQDLTINFGDNQAFVIARGNIYNVIPEA